MALEMKPIHNKADLAESCSQPRAFLFLWVNWAIQARQSEKTIRRLVESGNANCFDAPTPFYIADLSDQEGEVWEGVREWLRAEQRPVDPLTYGGCGALLWVVGGSVRAHCLFAAEFNDAKLLEATRSIFGVETASPHQHRELLAVLNEARDLLARPENDFSWSSWEDASAALAELTKQINAVERGPLPAQLDLRVLFAPTGPMQEVSLSSGWAQECLTLAAKFDAALAKSYP